MKLACPEIHSRSVSGCGNIAGSGSSAGGVSAALAEGACCGCEDCARAPGEAESIAASHPQVSKTNCPINRRIYPARHPGPLGGPGAFPERKNMLRLVKN